MATYYISTTGNDSTGNGNIGNPWASTWHAWQNIAPSDKVIIRNGTYTGMNFMYRFAGQRPPSGVPGAYTQIEAETDGGVIFDGQGTTSVLALDNVPASPISYISVRGIAFTRQSGGIGLYSVDHFKFKLCGFEGAGSGNTAAFSFTTGCDYCLAEDCWMWGACRYKYVAYHSSHIIFRRCITRHDRADLGGDNPTASQVFYTSTQGMFQNNVDVDMSPRQFFINGVNEWSGSFYAPTTSGDVIDFYMQGCIAYKTTMQFGSFGRNQTSTAGFDPNINVTNCAGWDLQECMLLRNKVTISHLTLGNIRGPALQVPNVGLQYSEGNSNIPPSIFSSTIQDVPGIGLDQFLTDDYNNLYNITTPRGLVYIPGSHNISTNPNLKYPWRIESGSPLKGAGADGDIGANIQFCYGVDGTLWGETGFDVLTATPAWPMPAEVLAARFMHDFAYTGAEGTVTGNRGFASDANMAAAPDRPLTNYLWTALGNPSPYPSGSGTQSQNLNASAASSGGIKKQAGMKLSRQITRVV